MIIHLVLLLAIAGGVPQPPQAVPPHLSMAIPAKDAYRWKWTEENWTEDDDAANALERKRLDKLFADGYPHEEEAARLKKLALKSPNDRKALFAWGYVTYLSHHADRRRSLDFQLSEALTSAKPPFTHEFARMRFLAIADQFGANDYVVALGERLVTANPKDFDVMHILSRSLSQT